MQIVSPQNDGGGRIDRRVGLWIDGIRTTSETPTSPVDTVLALLGVVGSNSVPSGDWAIYNVSTQNNYFAGALGINTTTNSAGNLAVVQIANGDTVFYGKRTTDSSPTGNFLQLQNASNVDLATIDISGNLTVKSGTFTGTLTVNGHVITGNSTGTTTVAANTAVCGTGCTVTISGNDTSGLITVNTGTGVTAGTLGTVTFGSAYGATPKVIITPETVPASSTFPQYYYGSNTTTFDLKAYTALTDSKTYKFSYHIEQ